MHLSNWRVGVRLGAGFALLLTLVLVMGTYALNRVSRIHDNMQLFATDWLPSTQQLAGINEALNQMRRGELQMMLGGDIQSLQDESARIAKQWDVLPPLLLAYEQTLSGEERDAYAALVSAIQSYRASQPRLLDLLKQGKAEEARSFIRGESRRAFRATTDAMAQLTQANTNGAAIATKQSESAYHSIIFGIAVILFAALAIGAFVAWLLTRSLTTPLAYAASTADRIADGDLSNDVHSDRRDELGDLLRALSRMQEALNASVSKVRAGADAVAIAAQEVSAGGHDLSIRTEQAAANIEQTSAAMQQVADTVGSSAHTSQQALQLANTAAEIAALGGSVVNRVVQTMSGIQNSSTKIGDIIGVIDGIAFQTNILALNAAVEAARAGEQGRGFAVVATEVRTLAQRSAQAAQEIKVLISNSVEQIDQGGQLVQEAGSTMSKVVSSVKSVQVLIGEIASSIRAQTQSVTEVNSAITQMDHMIQQNAALVEQSAAAAASLHSQAGDLSRAVGRFKLAPQ
ncbi:MCP four helix bundle domain-containing protein [Acidovorax sp. DW039]|uniref:methyl-accepting chemotaxis protein n=1 Tax=Acidovorax sp. DW039 TaxID=3095606 RepID=UPI003091E5C8|nr:MCP four helix bundle domain-containing protein [Acidovorax sp. DW039]